MRKDWEERLQHVGQSRQSQQRGAATIVEEGEWGMQEISMAKWGRALVAYDARLPMPPHESFQWILGEDACLDEVTVYLDASMFDGPDKTLAVLGWAFVAVKNGELIAVPRGVVPKHVRTIPAAETWALAMATMVITGKARYFTDCKAVKLIASSGQARATAASQPNARLWAIISGHSDGDTQRNEGIPSHLGGSSVGVGTIGDGTCFTYKQWKKNQLVVRRAKIAARQVRRFADGRKGVRRKRNEVATLAAWIARATTAANQGKEWPDRD